MSSRWSADSSDPRHHVSASAIGGAGWAVSITGGKAKMFAGVSRQERPPCVPFASLIHHCHIWGGGVFHPQFIPSLTHLGLEHLAQTRQRCPGCDQAEEPRWLI